MNLPLFPHVMLAEAKASDVSDWLYAPLVGGVLAALGYVAKLFIDLVLSEREKYTQHTARLSHLGTILNASHSAFLTQAHIRNALRKALRERGCASDAASYEECFTQAFDTMSDAERESHRIIRAYTEHTIKDLNEALLAWLNEDQYFRIPRPGTADEIMLAGQLRQMEVHLLLWKAKYQIWIPGQPQHALVYLDDEAKHGIGFPRGIEKVVERCLIQRGKLITWLLSYGPAWARQVTGRKDLA